MTGINSPEQYSLAIVEVEDGKAPPRYVRKPFKKEPDFGVTSMNYDLRDLLARRSTSVTARDGGFQYVGTRTKGWFT
jgi:hypothetical protein